MTAHTSLQTRFIVFATKSCKALTVAHENLNKIVFKFERIPNFKWIFCNICF